MLLPNTNVLRAGVAALVVAALSLFIASCNGNSAAADKTAQERADDYHKYLTTSDLSLLELRGNVKSVIYPAGFLNQYAQITTPAPDTILFTPSGMCELNLTCGNDTLRSIRTPEGRIAQLLGQREGAPSVLFAYADNGAIQSWQTQIDGVNTNYAFEYVEGKLVALKSATQTTSVKLIAADTLGNWTKRQLQVPGSAPILQERQIEYY